MARIHEPHFPSDEALFIIWAVGVSGPQRTVAAGCLASMLGAWEAIQDKFPKEEIWLAQGARIMRKRGRLA